MTLYHEVITHLMNKNRKGKIMGAWISERLSEPSSYAAVGLGVLGVGVILNQPILIYAGIVGGVVGFVLKEKGVI